VTVIDFTAFIGRLRPPRGNILPFFRTSLSIDNKSNSHDFDPVTEADRAAEAVDAADDQGQFFPSTALSARNSAASAKTPNMSGCWIRSTAPNPSSRLSDLGHVDRAVATRARRCSG